MKKYHIFLAVFVTLIWAFPFSSSWSTGPELQPRELQDELLLECRARFSDASTPIDGLYQVLRFGDTLFARYRHAPERELLQTDDVLFKRYTGDQLDELNRNGLLDQLIDTAGTERSLVSEVVYYGIDETDPAQGHFEMNVYRLQSIAGIGLGKVALLQNKTEHLLHKCH